MDEVIRYFVVHNFVCNFDSYTGSMIHNYYLYEEDGQLSMIPWDYNLAFGGFQGVQDAAALVNYPIDTPVSGGTVESRPMLAWIFASEEYTELYHQYFGEFIETYFDSGYFARMMDQVYDLIAPYVERDPTKFCTYEEFETGFAALKEFCLLRAESVSGQLAGTIPSTDEGQSQDSGTLVDASDLDISDMGSMNRGGMGGRDFPQAGEGSAAPETGEDRGETAGDDAALPADPEAGERSGWDRAAGPAGEAASGGAARGFGSAETEDTAARAAPMDQSRQGARGAGAFPGGETDAGAENSAWLLLGVSAAVLAAGILICFFYKKRV